MGKERINDAIKETLRCIQNASPGARKTRDMGAFSFAWMYGFVKSSLSSDLSGMVRRPKMFSE
jgi:hypothetical protein